MEKLQEQLDIHNQIVNKIKSNDKFKKQTQYNWIDSIEKFNSILDKIILDKISY